MKEGGWELTPLDYQYLAQVIEGHVGGYFITREGELMQILGSQKSGHQATCSLNSFIHTFILNFAFCLFLKEQGTEIKLKTMTTSLMSGFKISSLCY